MRRVRSIFLQGLAGQTELAKPVDEQKTLSLTPEWRQRSSRGVRRQIFVSRITDDTHTSVRAEGGWSSQILQVTVRVRPAPVPPARPVTDHPGHCIHRPLGADHSPGDDR